VPVVAIERGAAQNQRVDGLEIAMPRGVDERILRRLAVTEVFRLRPLRIAREQNQRGDRDGGERSFNSGKHGAPLP
jgi:hypothetical protein